jgi:precorrin-3B synthase
VAYNPGVPETASFASRPVADRCPGVLRLTEAADGFLARVRLPGGFASGAQLRVLARLAAELGDGRVELTSRGNLQLRGLAATAATPLTSELAAAGLLPSVDHDRVRNVLASPLAGLDGGPDLAGLVRALDAGLCARPRLAGLSGRFLFAVDDGRGDVAGLGADVAATIGGAGLTGDDGAVVNGLAVRRLAGPGRMAGACGGMPGEPRDGVVTVMLAFADAFLELRETPQTRAERGTPAEAGSGAWRIADLPGGADRVRAAVAERLGLAPAGEVAAGEKTAGPRSRAAAARPVGLVRRAGAAGGRGEAAAVTDADADSAVLIAPLGRLTAAQLTWVAERTGERAARITPWRSVVLPHVADAAGVLRDAARLGFGTDADSPWLRVTACAGRPGCASALADVQADAAGFAARLPGRIVHVSGCARHCGRPAGTEIDVTATSEGYQVAGV